MQKFSHELGLDLSLTRSNKLNLVGLELDNNKYTKDSKETKLNQLKWKIQDFTTKSEIIKHHPSFFTHRV